MAIRLVLAGDHPLVLETLLQREPDFRVVACCQRGEEALDAVRQHRPDLLILDCGMPGKEDLEMLRAMRQTRLPTRVVLLMASPHDEAILEAMLLGVGGIVLQERTAPPLVSSVRKVYAGDYWLDRELVGRAVETMLQREVAARELAQGLRHSALAAPAQELG